MHASAPQQDTTLYAYMVKSHQYLDDLYGELLDALAANAPDLGEVWTKFEHTLLAHMEAEERFVLPSFAKVDRPEAIALIRDHGMFREQLLELGVAVDLHAIRYERSREFVDRLRAHGAREDNLLYRWADEHLEIALATAALAHASR